MSEYRVGAPYLPGRTSWQEGADYNYRQGVHELRLFFARPLRREVEDIRRGPCEFALLESEHALFLLYRFGESVAWSDKPYSWHLVPEAQRTLPKPEPTEQTRALLHVILIDAATGLVRALRVVSWSPEFTRAIHAAIRRQAARPWPGDAAYNASIRRLYAQYPASEAMLADATARTKGGA